MLHGVEVGAGVLQQGTKDEGEADSQVDVYGFDEAVGIREGGAGSHHQGGHRQDRSHSCKIRHHIIENVMALKKNVKVLGREMFFSFFLQILP